MSDPVYSYFNHAGIVILVNKEITRKVLTFPNYFSVRFLLGTLLLCGFTGCIWALCTKFILPVFDRDIFLNLEV